MSAKRTNNIAQGETLGHIIVTHAVRNADEQHTFISQNVRRLWRRESSDWSPRGAAPGYDVDRLRR